MKHLLHKRPIPILLTVVLLGMIPLMFFSAHALFGDRSGELYTITWLVDGVAYEDDYASGELPEPPAGIVADFADEQYVYTFDYWLCEDDGERGIKPVTQSTTYSAVFKVKETRKYTVTWCNWDGSVLNVDEVEYGKIPEYMHEEPIKPSENQIAYVWDGWYPTPMMVQGNQTYTAVFAEEMEDGWHEIDGKYYYYMGGLMVVNDFVRLPYPDADVMPGYARDEEDFRVNQLTNPANTQRYEYPDGESAKFMIGEDGALCTEISGTIIDEDGAVRWIQNGMLVWHAGLVRDGGGYRYFKRNGMVKGSTVYVAKTNGLLDPGTYSFDENGFLIEHEGIVREADGTVFYYEKYLKTAAGLVRDTDGSFYYITPSKVAVRDGIAYVPGTKTNGLLDAGYYYFDADGRMITHEDGLCEINGDLYYMENYALVAKGLVESGGDYYYFSSELKVSRNRLHYISAARANGLKPAGVYQFGEDGKLIVRNGILRETLDDGKEYLFYYEDNVRQIGSGLLQLADGSYIYVRSGANLAVGRYYVTKNNDLLPSGYYEFDENGKMIVPSAGESETGNP